MALTTEVLGSNQLLFNLSYVPEQQNVATRYHKPKPILIQKLDTEDTLIKTLDVSAGSIESLGLTAIDSNRLDEAVQLAKRDLKQKKQRPTPLQALHSNTQPRSTVASRHRQLQKKADKVNKQKTSDVQPWRGSGVVEKRQKSERTSRAAHVPSARATSGGNELTRVHEELSSIQLEMRQALEHLQITLHAPELVPGSDEELRRAVNWWQGQETRSSRSLYSLNQQLNALNSDMSRAEHSVSRQKQLSLLERVRASHRSALRVARSLGQTPPFGLRPPLLPVVYQDLASVVRQLGVLSIQHAQIRVTADTEQAGNEQTNSGDTETAQHMLDVASSLGNQWEQRRKLELQQVSGPRAPEVTSLYKQKRQSKAAAALRESLPEDDMVYEPGKVIFKQKKKTTFKKPGPSEGFPPAESLKIAIPASARASARGDRSARGDPSIRSSARGDPSIRSSTRTAQARPQSARETAVRAGRGTARSSRTTTRRAPGVLIAGRTNKSTADDHYMASTFSSRVRDAMTSPIRHESSPHRSMSRARSQSPPRLCTSVDLTDLNASARGVALNTSLTSHVGHTASSRLHELRRSGRYSNRAIMDTEAEIRHRLNRYNIDALDGAGAGGLRGMKAQLTHSPRRRQLPNVSEADVTSLADQILYETMDDMEAELLRLADSDNSISSDIRDGISSPVLRHYSQALANMELAEVDIRKRWNHIAYHDTESHTFRKVLGDGEVRAPETPPAIHMTPAEPNSSDPTVGGDCLLSFTRPRAAPDLPGSLSVRMRKPRIHQLELPAELVSDVLKSRDRHRRSLERRGHVPVGEFDPWLVMQQLADVLLDEALQEVTSELGGLSDDVVQHVMRTEFSAGDKSLQSTEPGSPVSPHPAATLTGALTSLPVSTRSASTGSSRPSAASAGSARPQGSRGINVKQLHEASAEDQSRAQPLIGAGGYVHEMLVLAPPVGSPQVSPPLSYERSDSGGSDPHRSSGARDSPRHRSPAPRERSPAPRERSPGARPRSAASTSSGSAPIPASRRSISQRSDSGGRRSPHVSSRGSLVRSPRDSPGRSPRTSPRVSPGRSSSSGSISPRRRSEKSEQYADDFEETVDDSGSGSSAINLHSLSELDF